MTTSSVTTQNNYITPYYLLPPCYPLPMSAPVYPVYHYNTLYNVSTVYLSKEEYIALEILKSQIGDKNPELAAKQAKELIDNLNNDKSN